MPKNPNQDVIAIYSRKSRFTDEKDAISHRGRALEALEARLEAFLQEK